jgi:hypothetical protein
MLTIPRSAPLLVCSDNVKCASIDSPNLPTAIQECLDAPNRYLSPHKHSFFSAANLSQKNRDKQLHKCYSVLNYDHLLVLAIAFTSHYSQHIKIKAISVSALSSEKTDSRF